MIIIRNSICSGKIICYTPNLPNIVKTNQGGFFSSNIKPNQQYGKLQKGFDIISIIFRLVDSSNLGFGFFQIFEYIEYSNIFLNISYE